MQTVRAARALPRQTPEPRWSWSEIERPFSFQDCMQSLAVYNVVYHDAVPSVELHHDLRHAVRDLCKAFPDGYWRELDAARAYPDAFVKALTDAGYLAALIPEAYGGSGLGVTEAAIILEEINRSGGNAGACHAQMYTMGTLLRHGSDPQKRAYLPKIATGELRLQAFGVTEPTTGSDTTQLKTTATR